MEFWGKEVKPGATVSCKVDDDDAIHLSQVALGEPNKASENVIVSVKIDNMKLVLGTLSFDKHPQISCDLVFDKDFEISHNSKTATVFFCGYTSPVPQFESNSGEDSSDEELETDQIPMKINAMKVLAAKDESSSSDDDDDFTDSESGSEMSEDGSSEGSSDEDELSSGADPSDDSGSEETPKKTDVVVGKKRATEAKIPSGKKAKSEQSIQKKGDKKVSSPHSATQSSKTPADKSIKTPKSGSHACKSCDKSFGTASALEAHKKAKKHEA